MDIGKVNRMTKIELIRALQEHPSPNDIEICAFMITGYDDDEIELFKITEIETMPYKRIVDSAGKLSYDGYRETKDNENVLVLK